MKLMEDAVQPMVDKYAERGGAFYYADDVDDLYERAYNWGLFYAMGADRKVLDLGLQQWHATTRFFADDIASRVHPRFKPQIHNEYFNLATPGGSEWYHKGEANMAFYHFGLADPTISENVRRARRFAAMYMAEDPDAPNYDPQHKIFRCPIQSSVGPLRHASLDNAIGWLQGGRKTGEGYQYYGVRATLRPVVENLEPDWFENPERRDEILKLFDEIVLKGDVPHSLGSTALMTNAYLYTGEDKYRQWVLDYTEGWMVRMQRNNGIMPDNVGLTGQIGENLQGQWRGGFDGWSCRFAPGIISTALAVAAQCAHLVTGDRRYLQFLRSHLDMLLDMSVEQDGQLMVPCRYTDNGWKDYGPLDVLEPIHLWATSMEERDWLRLERLRRGNEEAWDTVEPRGPRGSDDRNWVRFIAGDLPDYPEQILRANYTEVCRRLDLVMQDEEDQSLVDEHHWQVRNPVVTEALAQLTTGGPQTMYWGGLAPGRVRYFDAQKRRPGLPEDIAALVTGLEEDSIDVTLVNLSPGRRRQVLIGAGSFGEHRFETVEMVGAEGRVDVGGTYLQVNMRPASQLDLRLTMKRWCNKPSYAFPWHLLS